MEMASLLLNFWPFFGKLHIWGGGFGNQEKIEIEMCEVAVVLGIGGFVSLGGVK